MCVCVRVFMYACVVFVCSVCVCASVCVYVYVTLSRSYYSQRHLLSPHSAIPYQTELYKTGATEEVRYGIMLEAFLIGCGRVRREELLAQVHTHTPIHHSHLYTLISSLSHIRLHSLTPIHLRSHTYISTHTHNYTHTCRCTW